MAKRAVDAAQLRKLPVKDRLKIVWDLWDSIADESPELAMPMTPELAAELERRLLEHQQDPGSAIPWEKVRDELREKLRSRK
jgi:putative addiction module component (TIGR02574 family)